jgi:collagenase-like PrtC family protease
MTHAAMGELRRLELVCPAGSLAALKVAVDAGADCVYTGFRDRTNARNFAGLNFTDKDLVEGIRYAHARKARVLTLAQVEKLKQRAEVEIEVFGFGSLCMMVEGRCALSSYVTGQSPNTFGVCSPAGAVRWQTTPAGLEPRLNGVLVDRCRRWRRCSANRCVSA